MSLIFSIAIIFCTSIIVFVFKLVINYIEDVRTAPKVVYYSEQERFYYDPIKQDIHLFPTSMLNDSNYQGLLNERERLSRSTEVLSKSVPKLKLNELKQIAEEFKENNKTRQEEEHVLRNKERVDLSVIVPAYNEEKRLPVMLDQAILFLEKRCRRERDQSKGDDVLDLHSRDFTYEIIVVDDGSADSTTKIAHKYSSKWGTNKIRVLSLTRNRGKGGAVRLGVLASRGRYVLFADADGASEFEDIQKLENAMVKVQQQKSKVDESNQDTRLSLVIGSRAHLEKNAIAERSLIRTILMKGFHFLVRSTCVGSVQDTQCGFKLFNRPAARVLFNSYHNESWAFDVELLYLAEKVGCDISEVPIRWNEIGGSKIVPVFSWLRMGIDIVCIAFYYKVGIYQVPIKCEDWKEDR